VALLTGLVVALPGAAQEAPAPDELQRLRESLEDDRRRLAEQQRRLAEQQRMIARQREVLSQQQAEIEELASTIRRRLGDAAAPAETEPPQVAAGAEAEARRRPDIAVLAERGGVLTDENQLVVEPSFEYIRSDVARAEITGFTVLPTIVFGDIEVTEASRDTLIAATTVRYGVTDRLEVEAKIPYVHRDDTTIRRSVGVPSAAPEAGSATGSDIGDVELAASYQLNDGAGGWPFFVGNLRVSLPTGTDPFEVPRDPVSGAEEELPTGTGFYTIEPSLTAIYPTDPAVLFGTLSYGWTPERDVGGTFGEVDPGDTVGFGLGLGVALNDALSFSMAYSHDMVFKTKQDGRTPPTATNLQLGSLQLGTSFRVNPRVSIDTTFSFGVTEDAPDMRALIRVPIRFDLGA
jgi:uncharacterized coiled-coil protein SlyX